MALCGGSTIESCIGVICGPLHPLIATATWSPATM
jgi:hypothetical protein